MKNSVIIYRSFYEALTGLPDSDFSAIFRAIIEYGLDDVEISVPEHLRPFFLLIKPQIQANVKRHSDGVKGAEHGLKGGRPKKYENTTEEKNPIPFSEKTPVGLLAETPKEKEKEKEKENVKEKVNEKVKEKEKENVDSSSELFSCDVVSVKNKSQAANKKRFTPPIKQDVIEYFKQNGYSESSAVKMFNYYEAGDWHDSTGKKIKNWRQKAQAVWFKPENEAKRIIDHTQVLYR